ncbi:uncharacterized protein LOC119068525 isoform X2 [Bradysia coprophila]|nr:uncharacterized protein LOC119068525 isoform X2 [Bradysia coprophila]
MVQLKTDIEAANGEPTTKSLTDGRICFLTYSVILSLVFIGVATNFYYTLLDIETSDAKCILTSTSPNWDLVNFCEHVRTWKLCGFYGIFLPGCIVLIFGSVSLFAGKDSQANSEDRYQMFDCLFSMTKVINVIVVITLWTSDVATTHITGSHGLGMAAKIYMVFLGLELGIVVAVLFIACLYVLCSF